MLTALRINNFAIVKQLELDFSQGMTAFTGETGAGKSIMIDALMLALGGRADASAVRSGEEKCDITVVFHISADSEPALWLASHDLTAEDGEVLLRRIVYAEGRSKSTINGQPFPLQKVKEFSEMLVHIHGQHQHQTLMQHATHRQQLDHYAGHEALLHDVQNRYKHCQQIKHELEALHQQDHHKDRRELLQFQIDEMQALALQENEMQQLSEEHQCLHHAQDYLQYGQQIMQLLSADDGPDICRQLNQILQLLKHFPIRRQVTNAADMINNALIQCEEALGEIQQFTDGVQLDPERLQAVENRMSTLHQAARKYHVDIDKLPAHLAQLEQELDDLKNLKNRRLILEEQYQQQLSASHSAALLLRESRTAHAGRLAEEISAVIRQLGMPKGYVLIDISPLDNLQVHGLDKIEYKVCTNPGMQPDALGKIASGGELSRISLAIQMITAQRGATPTLLFDEVDVGIGGATAALVGRFLRNLGERLQVFCVTHQPQVASSAHHHFVVEKYTDENQTFSKIIALQKQDKIDEIARMLGGLTITEQSRSHARELLLQSS